MKVLLAYPNKLVADGLRCLLNSQGDSEVVGMYSEADAVSAAAAELGPDVVVLHASFLGTNGRDYLEALRQNASHILIVSNSASREEFLWVIESGANGYISIEGSGAQFVEAVQQVSRGEMAMYGVDQKPAISDGAKADQKSTRLANLTPREKEILGLLAHGFSNRQIAENLYVSEHTVRTHVQNLRSKLNVRSKFQAAMVLMQAGSPAVSGMRF